MKVFVVSAIERKAKSVLGFIIFLSLIFSVNCFSSSIANSTTPLLLTGHYYNYYRGIDKILIGTSLDKGDNWQYLNEQENIPIPVSIKQPKIFNSTCNGSFCLAIGEYDSEYAYRTPLIITSNDSGRNWSVPDSILIDLPKFCPWGVFRHKPACTKSTCVVVGDCMKHGENGFSESTPLIATTQDAGLTWQYPDKVLPEGYRSYSLYDVDCSGNTCIAIGSVYDGRVLPLLAKSEDSGGNWVYTINSKLPSYYYREKYIGGISCSEDICVTAGDFEKGGKYRPLIAFSNDKGETWTHPADIINNVPESLIVGSLKNGVSCSHKICAAIGSYSDQNAIYPLLALTVNSGKNWVYPEDIKNKLPLETTYAAFKKVHCDEKTCVAVGVYKKGGPPDEINTTPLLAVSVDGGDSWTYPKNIVNPDLPYPMLSGGFHYTVCKENTCLAAGYYTYHDHVFGRISRPLLAVSNDKGITWSYKNSVFDENVLPPGFRDGAFY